jgi:hypothetical protein
MHNAHVVYNSSRAVHKQAMQLCRPGIARLRGLTVESLEQSGVECIHVARVRVRCAVVTGKPYKEEG